MKLEVDKAELYTKECSGAGLNDLENPLIHDLTVVAISSWPFGPADCLLFTVYCLLLTEAKRSESPGCSWRRAA